MEVLPESQVPFRSILFAAGRGERLRPLTDRVAKPAIVVGDRPLGAHGLARLGGFGPTLVNLSHLAEATRAALEPWAPPGTEFVVESPEPLGTAGTVAAALPRLEESFVTLNSDLLTDLEIADLVATHESLGAPGTAAVIEVTTGADFTPSDFRAGIARLSAHFSHQKEVRVGFARRFIDRRAEPTAAGVRFIGAAVFERRAVEELVTPGEVAGLGEKVLKPLAERGELALHIHEGLALDVGTADALAEARRVLER